MKKMILGFSLIISLSAQANEITCKMQEVFSGKESQQEFSLGQFNSGFGSGSVELSGETLSVNLTDPRWKKSVSAKLSAGAGSFSRVQIIPNERNNDYLILECERAGVKEISKATSAQCSLIETAGSQQFKTDFEVPVGQNGHDYYELPQAKIAPIQGWVMLYNDLLITSVQNKDLMTSVTGMGMSDQGTTLSWYPSSQNIKVTINCVPLF